MSDEGFRETWAVLSDATAGGLMDSNQQADVKKTQRNFVVFSSLVCVLTLTSALLLALAPAPLSPDATSLFAITQPDSMDPIFQTHKPCENGRWKFVYIHHSRTHSGSALSVDQSAGGAGDHFVIGNGDGAVDGEIQLCPRWDSQQSAAPPAGASRIDAACISICLVGDFDHDRPTSTQLRRLGALVNALQAKFHIAAQDVSVVTQLNNGAGIGRYFPAAAFREQLLP